MEERAGESLDSTREGGGVWECCMDAEDGDVLLSCCFCSDYVPTVIANFKRTCTLLRLDQTRRAVDAHNQTTGNFRIESPAVSGLFNA